MNVSRLATGSALLVLIHGSPPGIAQQAPAPALTGSVTLGVRSVDLSGTEDKYREDINLDDGLRVLDVTLRYAPSAAEDRAVDRVDFDASNLGGDPFETARLRVRKYGAYDLKLDHRRSAYFYADTILPASLADVAGSTGGDFHHFDFERVRDTADLDIRLSPRTQLSLGLERQTRKGESTTTLDVQRDEFEIERPLDESLNVLTFGIQHRWRNVTLIFDEQLRDFENTTELFLPGAAAGANTADPAELLFFRFGQAYDFSSRRHSLRVLADPSARLGLRAVFQREDLELDLAANEEAAGTGFTGAPFATDASGRAENARDLEHAAFELTFAVNDRIRLLANAAVRTLDQRGLLRFGADQGSGDWRIDTQGLELGIEFALRPNLLLAAGWSEESREVEQIQALNGPFAAVMQETDRSGYFGRLLFTTEDGLELTASVENGSIDDAFTLASPTGRTRYEASAKKRWANGISLTANHRRTDTENDLSGWRADTAQTDVHAAYRNESIELLAGAGRVQLERDAQPLVTAGTRQDLFLIDYDADARFWDVSLSWFLNRQLMLGGSLRSYDNRGSYTLDRDDLRLYADVAVGEDYTLRLSYRDVEYAEDPFDAYDAQILEVGLRLDW